MKKLFLIFLTFIGFSTMAANIDISVSELKTLIDSSSNSYVIIDVRNLDEYEQGHIYDAKLYPLPTLTSNVEEIQEKYGNKEIILICRSGNRSMVAFNLLKNTGLNLRNVKGGMKAWNKL